MVRRTPKRNVVSSSLAGGATSEQSGLCSDVFFTPVAKKTSYACSLAPPFQLRCRWAPVWGRRFAAVLPYHKEIAMLTAPYKKKGTLSAFLSFWPVLTKKMRVTERGKTALLGRAAFAAYKRFHRR